MKINNKIVIFGVLGIIFLWAISGFLTYIFIEEQNRGIFGDMFGSINALFSGLALFGIIISILIQQKELNLQRIELAETREEFRSNRLSNVVFKQSEMINKMIDDTKIIGGSGITLTTFVGYLEYYEQTQQTDEIKKRLYIDADAFHITDLVTKVVHLMRNFHRILSHYGIKESELEQLKKIFINNLNPHFISLLRFLKKYPIDFKSQNESIGELHNDKINDHLENIDFILNF